MSLKNSSKTKYKVRFGNNVLIGKNVKIGKNTVIGSNSIIEKMLQLEIIVLLDQSNFKNSIIGNEVVIQDGCKIGQKGFGFIPLKIKY